MLVALVFLAVVVLSGETRSVISSVSKDGQSQTLGKLLAVGIEDQMQKEDNGKTREKRDVSQLNIPQLTIAANLPNQSVCPWTYRIDSDANRRPVDLVEAVCIQPNSTDDVCLRIFYFIPVQAKMTSPDGTITWVDKLEKKVVGCTLAAPLRAMEVELVDSDSTRE